MKYSLLVDKKIESFIKKQPKLQALRLRKAIASLSDNPRSANSKKLKGYENEYRLRVGDIRILYTIDDNVISVYIFKIGYRGDVYK